MGLHIYTVHVKPGTGADVPPVFVYEGFSWGGFLALFFWTAARQLWLATLINIVVLTGLTWGYLNGYLSDVTYNVLTLAQCVYAGLEGNDWLRAGLARRGYVTAGVISGENRSIAERRYFEQAAAQGV